MKVEHTLSIHKGHQIYTMKNLKYIDIYTYYLNDKFSEGVGDNFEIIFVCFLVSARLKTRY